MYYLFILLNQFSILINHYTSHIKVIVECTVQFFIIKIIPLYMNETFLNTQFSLYNSCVFEDLDG